MKQIKSSFLHTDMAEFAVSKLKHTVNLADFSIIPSFRSRNSAKYHEIETTGMSFVDQTMDRMNNLGVLTHGRIPPRAGEFGEVCDQVELRVTVPDEQLNIAKSTLINMNASEISEIT